MFTGISGSNTVFSFSITLSSMIFFPSDTPSKDLKYTDCVSKESFLDEIKNSNKSFVKNIDYIFHLGAETFPKMSFDSPLKFYETNENDIELTRNLEDI